MSSTSFRHLELLLPVYGRVPTHKTDRFFPLVLGPVFELIHKLAEGEIDVIGKMRDMRIHFITNEITLLTNYIVATDGDEINLYSDHKTF